MNIGPTLPSTQIDLIIKHRTINDARLPETSASTVPRTTKTSSKIRVSALRVTNIRGDSPRCSYSHSAYTPCCSQSH